MVTTTAAFGAESRGKRSEGSNYDKMPISIIWVNLSMLIDRECLADIRVSRSWFVMKYLLRKLKSNACVSRMFERFDYSLSAPHPSAGTDKYHVYRLVHFVV